MRTLIISHEEDLDGVASAVMLSYALQCNERKIRVLFANYNNVDSLIKANAPDVDEIFITDLCLRNAAINECWQHLRSEKITVIDHHSQTSASIAVWGNTVTSIFDDSGTKCTADLVFDNFIPLWDIGISNKELERLRQITHSTDLYLRDEPMSEPLSDIITVLGADTVYNIFMHQISTGEFNFLDVANFNDTMRLAVMTAAVRRQTSLELARKTTVQQGCCVSGRDDSFMISACTIQGYQIDAGNQIRKTHPLGWIGMLDLDRNSLSFRTCEDTIAATGVNVRDIAAELGGGGHACAAGAPIPIEIYQGGSKALHTRMVEIITPLLIDRK